MCLRWCLCKPTSCLDACTAVVLLLAVLAAPACGHQPALVLDAGTAAAAGSTSGVVQRASQPSHSRCKGYAFKRYQLVATLAQLTLAVAGSQPGDMIELAPGTYKAAQIVFRSKKGTKASQLTLCGPPSAVLVSPSIYRGNAVTLVGCQWVNLVGFSVRSGHHNVETLQSSHCTLDGLQASESGQAALLLRQFSTHNTIKNCRVTNTGKWVPGAGEGIYVGESNDQKRDASNYNKVLNNIIGPGVTAECIDIKQFTREG